MPSFGKSPEDFEDGNFTGRWSPSVADAEFTEDRDGLSLHDELSNALSMGWPTASTMSGSSRPYQESDTASTSSSGMGGSAGGGRDAATAATFNRAFAESVHRTGQLRPSTPPPGPGRARQSHSVDAPSTPSSVDREPHAPHGRGDSKVSETMAWKHGQQARSVTAADQAPPPGSSQRFAAVSPPRQNPAAQQQPVVTTSPTAATRATTPPRVMTSLLGQRFSSGPATPPLMVREFLVAAPQGPSRSSSASAGDRWTATVPVTPVSEHGPQQPQPATASSAPAFRLTPCGSQGPAISQSLPKGWQPHGRTQQPGTSSPLRQGSVSQGLPEQPQQQQLRIPQVQRLGGFQTQAYAADSSNSRQATPTLARGSLPCSGAHSTTPPAPLPQQRSQTPSPAPGST